ncbi:MAG: hypothetical protein AAGC81_17485 [Pseudomonadota bacterium]
MAKIYFDNDAVQDLASAAIGLEFLSTNHQYIIPDYIWFREISADVRPKLENWGNATGALTILPVSEEVDFTDPEIAARYKVTIDYDANGNVFFPSGSQLGDGVYAYLAEEGAFDFNSQGIRDSFLISKDNKLRALSDTIDELSPGFVQTPNNPADLLLYQLENGEISKQDFQLFAPGLRVQAATYGAYVPSDAQIEKIGVDSDGPTLRVTYGGIEITPGVLTAAAVGAEALKIAGVVGDVYEVSLAISEARQILQAGDENAEVRAEAVYAQLTGGLAGGAAGTAAGVVLAGSIVAGSGVGVIPGTLILLAGGVAGGIAGAQVGEGIALELHNYAVTQLNNGDPLIIENFIAFYHDRLKENQVYEQVLLSQSLVGVSTGDAAAIQAALIETVRANPDLVSDLEVFEDALSEALVGHAPVALSLPELQGIQQVVMAVAGGCFLAGTEVSIFDGAKRLIEEVKVGDQVTSYDQHGGLVPGTVTRVFQNRVKHILDVFGLHVTPGHVTLCGDGPFAGRHVPMIDILRSDGALVRESGEKIRACTNEPVDSAKDQLIWAVTGEKQADGALKIRDRGRIRLGTRFITAEGYDISVADLIASARAQVTADGLIQQAGGEGVPFYWSFTPMLPRPEDYVLQRSALKLNDIYQAAEWEAVQPQVPAPDWRSTSGWAM